MSKVLLLFEDINELGMVDGLLKKLGFDTLSAANEYSLKEQILGFNPQLVMIHGRNRRVHTVAVAQKLKQDSGFKGKVILIVQKGERFASADLQTMRMDGVIEAPFEPKTIVFAVAKVLGLDKDQLLEKYDKMFVNKNASSGAGSNALNQNNNSGGDYSSANNHAGKGVLISDPNRAKKYDAIAKLAQFDTSKTNFEKNQLKKAQDEMTKDWDKKALEDQDKLKQQFVKAMFQKAEKK